MTGNGATSAVTQRIDASHFDVSTGQVRADAVNFYGNFIGVGSSGMDWGTRDVNNNTDLWGSGTVSRDNAHTSLVDWTPKARANNPCPPGWRIPLNFDFTDMNTGNGMGFGTTVSFPFTGNNNTWTRRHIQSNTNAYGGVIVTNNLTGSSFFLPMLGVRVGNDGAHLWPTSTGPRWMALGVHHSASTFNFSNQIYGSTSTQRSHGLVVRCVQ